MVELPKLRCLRWGRGPIPRVPGPGICPQTKVQPEPPEAKLAIKRYQKLLLFTLRDIPFVSFNLKLSIVKNTNLIIALILIIDVYYSKKIMEN